LDLGIGMLGGENYYHKEMECNEYKTRASSKHRSRPEHSQKLGQGQSIQNLGQGQNMSKPRSRPDHVKKGDGMQ
jgi:hypothetical protein